MTPSQLEILSAEIRETATDLIASMRSSNAPPCVWLGILGCAVNTVLDDLPQETRLTIAKNFCDHLIAYVTTTRRFDA